MPKKKGYLGCAFPVLVGVGAAFIALLVVGFIAGPIGSKIFGDLGLPSWLAVPRPEVRLPAEEIFHLFGFPITNTIITAWISIAVLVGVSYAFTRRLRLIPARLQSAYEYAHEALLNFCQSVAGEKNGRQFFPLVATIFLFVITNAWLSLIPGFESITVGGAPLLRGANTDINMPLALALVSFGFVQYFGLRSHGVRYLGKFFNVGPFIRRVRGKARAGEGLATGIIHIFVGMLEALSEVIRIVSFTFRLFGNMTAGAILLLMAMFLVPWVVALPFYGLELLIGFVQALIFAGLTLVFVTVAVVPHRAEAA